MASGGLQESAAGSAAGTGAANSRIAPPVIPPKPPMLRQPNSNNAAFGSGDISPGGLYDTRQSSSDGFSTEKTSDSFPTSPSASTDPLASAAAAGLPPNLHGYRINPPISPVQTPVHLGYAPPPPPPPHQYLQQQQQNSAFSSYSSAATSHMRNPQAHHPSAYHQLTSHSNETDIYNVRLNDHVPPPLKAEEMAVRLVGFDF
ncbi:hypothetical protein LPJ56_000841 [Coemansia sp. RSA 2599]|nr:hypothetical protein LPJ56_000841 [Coemansia sp. RSA 2599]